MKYSLLMASTLLGSLVAGTAQAREVTADVTPPAATHVATDNRSSNYVHWDHWNGVPSYLMRSNGTLDNDLLPTNPDAQG